jgi:hypothetical protein
MVPKPATHVAGSVPEPPSTWVDPVTGLEWQCQSPGRMNWHQAREYAQSLSLAGHSDWRLPAVRELESLLDRSRCRLVVRPEIPFGDACSYWSRTTFGRNGDTAWIVMFDGAYVLSYYKTNRYYVRCLRGPVGARLVSCSGM